MSDEKKIMLQAICLIENRMAHVQRSVEHWKVIRSEPWHSNEKGYSDTKELLDNGRLLELELLLNKLKKEVGCEQAE